jgi:hypothetical protein
VPATRRLLHLLLSSLEGSKPSASPSVERVVEGQHSIILTLVASEAAR